MTPRARARAQLAEFKRRMRSSPVAQQARKKATRRRQLLGLLLLLLLLLIRCDCQPGKVPAAVKPTVDAGTTLSRAASPKLKAAERNPKTSRPAFQLSAQAPPPWLDAFRMQVAARSPRLSKCFNGTERPGSVRWNLTFSPESGSVSEHTFEPVGRAELSESQHTCMTSVLSSPPYAIEGVDPRSVPPRLSLVIEF
jgi:hypothetical protein